MNTANVVLGLCSGLALAPLATGAAEPPGSGLMLTPERLEWKPNPRVAGLEVASILGDATKPGPYVQRVKFPPNQVVQAHSHPDDRTYTVITGTWHVGWGKAYDPSKLTILPAGSFYTEPANVPHFVATRDGEAIVQITGTGPTAVHYVNPAYAPKK